MDSGLPGVFAGALALIALQTVVSSQAATGRVGGIFDSVASGASRFLDARVPLFNTAKSTSSSSGGSSPSGPSIVPGQGFTVPNPFGSGRIPVVPNPFSGGIPGLPGLRLPNPFSGGFKLSSATDPVTPPIPSAGTV